MTQENGSGPSGQDGILGTDITQMAAENASYGERVQRDPYAFSGEAIEKTFLTEGKTLPDTMLRSVYEGDVAHLTSMQFEQGLRVWRWRAINDPGSLPESVKHMATMPPSMGSAVISGIVAAAKDGAARQQALVAWSGGALMMQNKRGVGSKFVAPNPGAAATGGLS